MLIGKRERFQNIRQVWPRENDFSDWLVSDDGIEFLATELEIEIEDTQRECRAGDYPCDIVGRMLGEEDHIVVIENQYGKTDHDHLGKLLTYAAVHKAMTGIWIAEQISDDHRQVIDWLNENTPPNINFYMVALELYRIGNSPVAPVLDIVCRPNKTIKEERGGLSLADRERHAWRLRMWEMIHEHVSSTNPPFRLQKPSVNHWSSIAIGRSYFHLAMLLTPKNDNIAVELYIQPSWKTSAFQQLLTQKEEIERELDHELDWQPLHDKKASRILLRAPINPKDPTNEETIKNWFAEYTVRMYEVFKPRVAALIEPDPEELESFSYDSETT